MNLHQHLIRIINYIFFDDITTGTGIVQAFSKRKLLSGLSDILHSWLSPGTWPILIWVVETGPGLSSKWLAVSSDYCAPTIMEHSELDPFVPKYVLLSLSSPPPMTFSTGFLRL